MRVCWHETPAQITTLKSIQACHPRESGDPAPASVCYESRTPGRFFPPLRELGSRWSLRFGRALRGPGRGNDSLDVPSMPLPRVFPRVLVDHAVAHHEQYALQFCDRVERTRYGCDDVRRLAGLHGA